jgi:CMP-N-acetylneuraminic acid synthetase
VSIGTVLRHAVDHIESRRDIYPDIVVQLSVHTPLRRPEHIREAVDTLLTYDCDSVVSVYEDWEVHFVHGDNGLEALNPGMINRLQLEREALYVDNQSIHALWRTVVSEERLYGRAVGHVIMSWRDSLQARGPGELAMVEHILARRE